MKLLMENWRNFLIEVPEQAVILQYIKDNNILLTEQQIDEGMPRWLRNMVATGMLITTAAGVLAPNPAMADEWDDMFAQSTAERQVEAPDAAKSSEVGESMATKVFDMVKDKIPDGSTINLHTNALPSADLDAEAFGTSLVDSLQDLLATKNIKVLDKGIQIGPQDNNADGNLEISIMDLAPDGTYSINLSGGGGLGSIDIGGRVK